MSDVEVTVIEVGQAGVQVVTIGADSAPTPVYVPGSGGGGVGGPRAFTQTVGVPTLLVQCLHDLSFAPAGVLCTDASGFLAEPDAITYPLPGVVEVAFGVPFSGTIRLS